MTDSKPLVGVVMGSANDMDTMQKCLDQLEAFGIAYEVKVVSAHRTPVDAHEYCTTARQRGLKIIIAGAGMSAALSGVMAAGTTLPVIGVPIASGPLNGVDAALSTLQMPPGVPVAAVAIGSAGAKNAGVLAAEILALADQSLAEKLETFKKDQAEGVRKTNAKVQEQLGNK